MIGMRQNSNQHFVKPFLDDQIPVGRHDIPPRHNRPRSTVHVWIPCASPAGLVDVDDVHYEDEDYGRAVQFHQHGYG